MDIRRDVFVRYQLKLINMPSALLSWETSEIKKEDVSIDECAFMRTYHLCLEKVNSNSLMSN